jgi:hypothetical protein
MLIPVFVSMPNTLSRKQSEAQQLVLGELGHQGIEARTLGRTDYPTSFPLREVLTLAKHCSGGVILGFSQFEATAGTWKKGTPFKSTIGRKKSTQFPTPWNQLEAGILFALNVPLLVFRESGISGGVFDNGVTDLFVHPMPRPDAEYNEKKALRAVFQKWTAQVRAHYYGETHG